MPWATCCADAPFPDLQGWGACEPTSGGGGGDPVTVLVEGALQTETPFSCACDENGDFAGWVFNVIEDELQESDTATVVDRSLGFRDLSGAWTDDWALPAGWTLGLCDAKALQMVPPPEAPIVAPCSGCPAVDGVVDPLAFAVHIDGVATWYTVTNEGTVPITGTVEVLDPCDPRCAPQCCTDPDCECVCTVEDLASAATVIGAGA